MHKLLYGNIHMRVPSVSHQITLTLDTTLLFVFLFNEKNEHHCNSKLELRSLSEGQDALDLLTEGILHLQKLCLFTLNEAKNQ